MHVLFEITTKN